MPASGRRGAPPADLAIDGTRFRPAARPAFGRVGHRSKLRGRRQRAELVDVSRDEQVGVEPHDAPQRPRAEHVELVEHRAAMSAGSWHLGREGLFAEGRVLPRRLRDASSLRVRAWKALPRHDRCVQLLLGDGRAQRRHVDGRRSDGDWVRGANGAELPQHTPDAGPEGSMSSRHEHALRVYELGGERSECRRAVP